MSSNEGLDAITVDSADNISAISSTSKTLVRNESDFEGKITLKKRAFKKITCFLCAFD